MRIYMGLIEIDITIEAATASQQPLVTEACSAMLLLPYNIHGHGNSS
jgi:hypothetical protein